MFGLVAIFWTGNSKLYGSYVVAYVICCEISTTLIKQIAKLTGSLEKYRWLQRPSACGPRGTTCTGCGIIPDTVPVSEVRPGFPSGHSAGAAFDAVFWIMQATQKPPKYNDSRAVIVTIMCFRAVVVMTHRYFTRCHSPLQIFVGGLLGGISGFFSYIYLNTKYPTEFPLRSQWLLDFSPTEN